MRCDCGVGLKCGQCSGKVFGAFKLGSFVIRFFACGRNINLSFVIHPFMRPYLNYGIRDFFAA